MSAHEFWHQMGMKETNAAVEIAVQSGMTKKMIEAIWEEEKKPGLYWE